MRKIESPFGGFSSPFPALLGRVPSLSLDFINNAVQSFKQTVYTGPSNKTMVDSDGLLKWAPHNLLTNSEAPTGWTANGTALTISDGVFTVTETTATSEHYSACALVSSAQVDAVIDVRALGRTKGRLDAGTSSGMYGVYFDLESESITSVGTAILNAQIDPLSDDWYRITIKSSIANVFRLVLRNDAGANTYTGDGVSGFMFRKPHAFRSDLGGMVDNPTTGNSYVPTQGSPVYLPRVGHHVYEGGEWVNKGLLLESAAATNLDSSSNSFTTEGSTVLTSNSGVSPSGITDAVLVEEATASVNNACLLGSVNTAIIGATICNAIRVKYVSGSGWIALVHRSNSYSNQFFAWFNILTGERGSAEGGSGNMTYVDHNIFYEGEGWYVVYTVGTDSASGYFNGFVTSAKSDLDKSREGGSAYFVWQRQLTQGTLPSSLIPTNGSQVTRAAETLTVPAANLPWPQPKVIGPELVTNGTFDTDATGWTLTSVTASTQSVVDGKLRLTVGGGDANARSTSPISTKVGAVYQYSLDVDIGTSGAYPQFKVGPNAGSADILTASAATPVGTITGVFVATSTTTYLTVQKNDAGDGEYAEFDNISVREINPLALSLAMSGEVNYADNSLSKECVFFDWKATSTAYLTATLNSVGSRTGQVQFTQRAGTAVVSIVNSAADAISPGLDVPISFAGIFTSNSTVGAIDGVLLDASTTPTHLPSLHADSLSLLPVFSGTIAELNYWDEDIGFAELVEETT